MSGTSQQNQRSSIFQFSYSHLILGQFVATKFQINNMVKYFSPLFLKKHQKCVIFSEISPDNSSKSFVFGICYLIMTKYSKSLLMEDLYNPIIYRVRYHVSLCILKLISILSQIKFKLEPFPGLFKKVILLVNKDFMATFTGAQ